ncbi:MAG TPA: OprD family outer membrane porin [Candidatus Limnocylindria bacterium]|nr:OprD family outer membrane porin [Candidatus Limnocylindria bacterium]
MLNQHTDNYGGTLHVNYRFAQSGFSVGASYFYANPFDGCNDPRSASLTCATLSGAAATANPNHFNPTPDLPAYGLSTIYETYVQYHKNGLDAKIGNQVLNTPWANAADARLKPYSFQGADVAYDLNPHMTVEMIDVTRFQPRTSTDWLQSTVLTGGFAELPHTPDPPESTGGFQYGRIGYASSSLTTNLHFYHFENLANLAWLDGKYTFKREKLKPWIAIQAGDERNAGSAIVGQVDAQAYGLQLGVNVTKNLVLTAAGDVIPHRVETLAGGGCTVGTGQITPTQKYPYPSAGYFVGTSVPQCFANSDGTYSVAYGGIASPYTSASDPLFTTSITQGMIERGAGSSEKLGLVYTSTDKRLIVSLSKAFYDYGFSYFPDQTTELNADAMYHLNAVRRGPYKGLILRYRYGVHTDDHSSAINYPGAIGANGVYFGALPYVEFNRAQIEYDF